MRVFIFVSRQINWELGLKRFWYNALCIKFYYKIISTVRDY